MNDLDEKFSLIRNSALQIGLENAISKFRSFNFIDSEEAEQFRRWYGAGVVRVGQGGPVIKRKHEGW